jgi:hypothetical protein
MLSAIKIIGACLIILVAVSGLIAIVLMSLIRIKNFFRRLREAIVPQQRRPVGGLKESLRAIAIEARSRPGRLLLTVAIASTCAYFISYILLALVGLGALSVMIAPIARRRGWGSEGRLSRHLSRPPFVDESRRTDVVDGVKPVG